MSDENVEIVQGGYAAFLRGDMTGPLADVDEHVIATRVAPMPDVRPYNGPEGLLRILADWVEGFDDFETSQEGSDASRRGRSSRSSTERGSRPPTK